MDMKESFEREMGVADFLVREEEVCESANTPRAVAVSEFFRKSTEMAQREISKETL